MRITCDEGSPWWSPRSSPLHIDFTESKIAEILARGNALVPEMIHGACRAAELPVRDIGLLVTNQPNAYFLRSWREGLDVAAEKHIDSFDEYGNLFGAAIPINVARAAERGLLKKGLPVALGGFSHAGDYAAAAVWLV